MGTARELVAGSGSWLRRKSVNDQSRSEGELYNVPSVELESFKVLAHGCDGGGAAEKPAQKRSGESSR